MAIKDEAKDKIYLLDGHHRFAAAHELGFVEIPILLVNFGELPGFYLYYNSFEQIRRAAKSIERFR